MKVFLAGVLSLAITSATAQEGNLKVTLSKASNRLPVYMYFL